MAPGQTYPGRGEYVCAVQAFEQVLRFENLPPDLRRQAEIDSKAAHTDREGKRLSGFGFAQTGGGHDRTGSGGPASVTDRVMSSAITSRSAATWTIGSATTTTPIGAPARIRAGTRRRSSRSARADSRCARGRASYRGANGYRQDYGLFVNRSLTLDQNNQISLEGKIRFREYPARVRASL